MELLRGFKRLISHLLGVTWILPAISMLHNIRIVFFKLVDLRLSQVHLLLETLGSTHIDGSVRHTEDYTYEICYVVD